MVSYPSGMHIFSHSTGQKNLTAFPVIRSFFLHRLPGSAETHVAQSLSWLLLKRKVLQSSHFSRSSHSEDIGGDVGDAVGTESESVIGLSIGADDGLPVGDNVEGDNIASVGFVVGDRVGKDTGDIVGDRVFFL